MIGMFAISVPALFRPAAGIGLLIGGAVGVSVEVGVVITYKLWKKMKKD